MPEIQQKLGKETSEKLCLEGVQGFQARESTGGSPSSLSNPVNCTAEQLSCELVGSLL